MRVVSAGAGVRRGGRWTPYVSYIYEGITGMAVTQRRQLVIPPQLGYGARGAPPAIPPNALLHFDVELVEIGESSGGLWSKIASVLKALPLK